MDSTIQSGIKKSNREAMPVLVKLIAAMTLCGRISPGIMGSDEDRRFLEEARTGTDASLLGASTLRQGDPEMRGPDGVLPEKRLRAIITATGDIPMGRSIFQNGPQPIIFTSQHTAAALGQKTEGLARVLALPEGPFGLSIWAAIEELHRLGAASVLIEGGAKLNYAALREGVVNELLLTITPKLSGHTQAASLADGPLPLGDPFLRLELLSSRVAESGEIFCRYTIPSGVTHG